MKSVGVLIISLAPVFGIGNLARGATAENAAPLYEQAFAALPTTPADIEVYDNWQSARVNANTLGLAQRCQQCRLLLHQAALAPKCDWGWDFKKGPALKIPELNRIRPLGKAATLWIRLSFDQKHESEAVQSVEDLANLGRRLAAAPLVITGLNGRALESEATYVTAAYLQTLTPASLQQLQSSFETLPPNPPLPESLQKEQAVIIDLLFQAVAKGGNDPLYADLPKQPGEASKAVFACQDLYAESVRIASLSPDKAAQAMSPFKAKLASAPVICQKMTVADPSHLAMAEAHHREDIALFEAAITVVQKGRAALQSTSDPVGGGPFGYREIRDGFELLSKLTDRGEAVTIQVGPEAFR
jgi:hypothetical protein